MPQLNFKKAPAELTALVNDLATAIPHFRHVDPARVHIIFSNSRTRALGYCHAMSRRIQFALGIEPHYVIELIERKWQKLSPEEKAKVLLHELYHIPRTFSGNLRNHDIGFGRGFRQIENELLSCYVDRHPKMAPAEAREFLLRAVQAPV